RDLTVTGVQTCALPISAAIATFRRDAVIPILGDRPTLSEDDWRRLQDRLGPCVAWRARLRGPLVAQLGIARVRAILTAGAEAARSEERRVGKGGRCRWR